MTDLAILAGQAGELLARLRARAPRVHCITNDAAQAFTANVLLAVGARPSLTTNPKEIRAFVGGADAVLVNLGTLDDQRSDAIGRALDAVAGDALPWVLDPVLVNRSPHRADFALHLLERRPAILRCNATELETLRALAGHGSLGEVAASFGGTIAETGAKDVVCDVERTILLENGDQMMTRVTAIGCAQAAVMAALLAVEHQPFLAAASALMMFGVAGEVAAAASAGPGSFAVQLLDALYRVDALDLARRARGGG